MAPALSKMGVTIGAGLVLELVSTDVARTIYRCDYNRKPGIVNFWPWSRVKEEMLQVNRPAIPMQQQQQQQQLLVLQEQELRTPPANSG
jgi:hypothetical protein